ncbi:MAG: hypothetical protein U5Q44_14300 [Dehalococcoidia bacterium]|nr:hypothetical protein [Dehalococcoidia bacterium]
MPSTGSAAKVARPSFGVYNDDLVRTSTGWRFSKRTVTPDS